MNKFLRNVINEHGVKFNTTLTNGISRILIEDAALYLDNVIKAAITTTKNIPLEYHGYRYLTPEEDYKNEIESGNKNKFDISRNYLYKVEYKFSFDGQPINKVVALPFLERGNLIKLSDANYVLTPVLSEYPISPTPSEVFIRLLRDKIIIKSMSVPVLINGVRTHRQVIYGKTYKLTKEKINEQIPIALYVFIKYGFYGLYKHWFNTEPVLIQGEYDREKYKDYVEFASTGVKPKLVNNPIYTPHDIKILIPKDDVNSTLEIITTSLLYTLDLNYDIASELLEVAGKKQDYSTDFTLETMDDETLFWLILLGKTIFRTNYTRTRLVGDMLEHIEMLNGYITESLIPKIKEAVGVRIDNIYDLYFTVIDSFNVLVINYEKYASNIDNRYIELLYYILYEHIVSINRSFLEIKRLTARRLTYREVEKALSKLSTKKIFNLIKSNNTNLAIMNVDYSGDNYYFKMTSILEDQNRGDGVKRNKTNKRNALPPNTRNIQPEDIVFGSVLHLIKKYPSPRFRMNPTVDIDLETGKFVLKPEDKRMIEELKKLLSKKEENIEGLDVTKLNSDASGLNDIE